MKKNDKFINRFENLNIYFIFPHNHHDIPNTFDIVKEYSLNINKINNIISFEILISFALRFSIPSSIESINLLVSDFSYDFPLIYDLLEVF